MRHAKVITITPVGVGMEEIKTEGYYDQLNSVKIETQQSILTSKASLLSDIIKCLSVLTDKESRELVITITTNQYYEPERIIKKWTVKKEQL